MFTICLPVFVHLVGVFLAVLDAVSHGQMLRVVVVTVL